MNTIMKYQTSERCCSAQSERLKDFTACFLFEPDLLAFLEMMHARRRRRACRPSMPSATSTEPSSLATICTRALVHRPGGGIDHPDARFAVLGQDRGRPATESRASAVAGSAS